MSSRKTESSPKSNAGRPTKYKKQYCEQLILHMKNGLSFESFAAEVMVNRDTLYEWVDKHKEFSDAKGQGEVLSLSFWEKAGRAAAFGKTAVDFRYWNRFMLCRFGKFGWNPERHAVSFQDPNGGFQFEEDESG
jgi:hypothetical protein